MPTLAVHVTYRSLPDWLPAEVWPFDVATIGGEGSSIAISEVGRGPVLLFYTGIGSFVWRDVMLRLSSEFRCVAIDPPGIGLSGQAPRSALTLQSSSRAVQRAIQALDLHDLTLVLHDTGCPPALAAASREPDRVSGIVGVNTFAWPPSGAAFRGMLALMGSGPMRRFDSATKFLPWVTSTKFGVGRHLDETSRRAYHAGLSRSIDAFHVYLGEALHSDALFEEVSRALSGPFRRLPLLTIFGERNDPLKFQPQWKLLFPSARQVVIPKGNHFPMCDDPDRVASVIRDWHREFISGTRERRQ